MGPLFRRSNLLCLLFLFKLSTLKHFLLGKTNCFPTQFPHFLGGRKIPYCVGLLILKNLTTRSAGTSRLSVGAPTSHCLSTAIPAPINTRLSALWVVYNLSKTFPSFLHTNVATRDVLHEPRERLAKPGTFFAEESGLSDTARVHGGKHDTGIFVVKTVKLGHGHHIAYFGIFVSLGTKEWLAIRHGNRLLGAFLKSLEFTQISLWVDETSTDGIGISSDGPHDADTSTLGTRHVIHQEMNQQKMAEVIDTHGHFKPIVGPGRFRIFGLVHGSIADQVCQRTGSFERFEVAHKIADRLQITKFKLHNNVRVVWESLFFGDLLALFDIATRHDDKISPRLGEGCGAVQTQPRRRAGNDYQFSEANLETSQYLGHFLFFFKIQFIRQLCFLKHSFALS
mmetsp:Transcript_85181/g.227711  ORF Transcript_85181/g.227711 Transcript_85181/m.227711 type:complete len:396 (-) Transcript_85181:263-1450(-)